jgi:hypothetical protein
MSEKRIWDLYSQLNLWTNPVCAKCKSTTGKLSGPISIWQVGEDYESDAYRLGFIGKTARGGHEEEEQLAERGFIDWTSWTNDAIRDKGWHHWSYTRAIIESLFGSVENGWRRVAFTNLVSAIILRR